MSFHSPARGTKLNPKDRKPPFKRPPPPAAPPDRRPSSEDRHSFSVGLLILHGAILAFSGIFLVLLVLFLSANSEAHDIQVDGTNDSELLPISGLWVTLGKKNEGISLVRSGKTIVVTEFTYDKNGNATWGQGVLFGESGSRAWEGDYFTFEQCGDEVCTTIVGDVGMLFVSDSFAFYFPPDRFGFEVELFKF